VFLGVNRERGGDLLLVVQAGRLARLFARFREDGEEDSRENRDDQPAEKPPSFFV
jgi:hypothetical protein